MKRREFIKNTIAGSTLVSFGGVPLSGFEESKLKHLTILHTNDVHSHIDPFPTNHPKYPNMGGVVNRAILIEKIKKENPNVLLLDAGDSFQGTPYFNYYGGELEFKLMSKMGYAATTIGNHEFDNGIEGLAAQMPHAKFAVLSANYDFRNTIMAPFVKPYKIFNKNGFKVGVFGLGVELAGLVDKKMYQETIYNDPVEISIDIVKKLKSEEQCDLIVCLSHLGYAYKNDPNKICDIKLASLTRHIDLIIGGHTHTFLEKPTVVKNLDNQDVLINQVGCYGINLGRIDFYFSSDSSVASQGKSIIV
ncbi:bifunctional UDP-sugar hydrolase/5'-nucleotidase [Flavobacterium sp.]|uniref:bifunctional metallophosphatase/5'-nucleotidase n=1 Tax=Flavobacterium sp. TaxID=239 RepID=UPI0035296B7E